MARLGATQVAVLGSLTRHKGEWYENCGWTWGGDGNTRRIMESLEKKGMVRLFINTPVKSQAKQRWNPSVVKERWRITDAGRMIFEEAVAAEKALRAGLVAKMNPKKVRPTTSSFDCGDDHHGD